MRCTRGGTLWALDRATFREVLCGSKVDETQATAAFLGAVPLFSSLAPEQVRVRARARARARARTRARARAGAGARARARARARAKGPPGPAEWPQPPAGYIPPRLEAEP